jgi:hypothetical protein
MWHIAESAVLPVAFIVIPTQANLIYHKALLANSI